MTDPTINAGQYGHGRNYVERWGDDFDGSQGPLFTRWQPDLMVNPLHQVGNNNADFRRWACWYDKPEECAVEANGALEMRAVLTEEPDDGRKPFVYRGVTYNPQNYKVRLAFLTTWARRYDQALDYHVTDPDSPNRTWGPGTVFEFKVDLTEMRTQCIRISFYLLPAYENDSNTYTVDGTLGVENDFPEIDFLDGYEDYAQGKVISGLAGGNTPAGSIDLSLKIPGIDLTTGEHTFTLLWQKDRFVWYCDGIEYQRDTDPRRIPLTPHYIVISREGNSGAKPASTPLDQRDPNSLYSDGTPELPEDVGLWGRPMWVELDNIDGDTAKILSFKSWAFVDQSEAGRGIGDDVSGISPTMTTTPPLAALEGDTFTYEWSPNGRVVSDWYIEVGSSRGGHELARSRVFGTSYTMTYRRDHDGPINVRLWFRENDDSIWHWRDFGFSYGLQPYMTGTEGRIRKTTNPRTVGSIPTVAGLGAASPEFEPLDPNAVIVPNPEENQPLVLSRSGESSGQFTIGQQDWFELVRGIDPEVLRNRAPGFIFSGGRRLSIPADVLRKTVGESGEPTTPVDTGSQFSTPQLAGRGITLTSTSHRFIWTDINPSPERRYQFIINGVTFGGVIFDTFYDATGLPDDGSEITVTVAAIDEGLTDTITLTAFTQPPTFTANIRVV